MEQMGNSPAAPARGGRGGREGAGSGPQGQLNQLYDMSTGRILSYAGSTPLKMVRSFEAGGNKRFVIRTLPVKRLSADDNTKLREMISKLKSCQHVNVAAVVNVVELGEQLAVVSEYCSGGDIIHRLSRTPFNEKAVASHVRAMLAGLQAYHTNGVPTFGCLRIDSFLFPGSPTSKEDGPIKIVETGLKSFVSSVLVPGKPRWTAFTAPETLDNRPCPASDLWFVGVLVYLLLGGSPPFLGADDDAMQKAIRGAELCFSFTAFEHVSPSACDFITRLLVRDPQQRMTLAQAQAHEWLTTTPRAGEEAAIPGSHLVTARKFRRGGGLKEVEGRSGDKADSSSLSDSGDGSTAAGDPRATPTAAGQGGGNSPGRSGLVAVRPEPAKGKGSARTKLTLAQMLDEFEANGLM